MAARPASLPRPFLAFAALLVVFFAAAGAPTPLYATYQQRYGFSAVVLTLIFAVYVLALLSSLLVFGRVSDHAGRRPVLAVALVIQLAGMALFVLGDATGWLVAARAVQGFATGLATSALSAALLDTTPRPSLAGSVASGAPLLGLAGGALAAATLVDLAPDPRHLVYLLLAAGYVLALILLPALPEPLTPDGQWRSQLRPRLAVPRPLWRTFITVIPCAMATWALGGFYLSLGPSLLTQISGSGSDVVAVLAVVALVGIGGVTAALTQGWLPERLLLGGAACVVVGVAVAVGAIAASSFVLLLVGSAIAGLGFGPAFAGVLRVLTADTRPHERAGLMSAIYVASYFAFSVPAIIAGVAETHAGLRDTAMVYAAAVVVLATAATGAYAVQVRRPGLCQVRSGWPAWGWFRATVALWIRLRNVVSQPLATTPKANGCQSTWEVVSEPLATPATPSGCQTTLNDRPSSGDGGPRSGSARSPGRSGR